MKSMTATKAKYEFGRLLDAAQREPVTIEKNGRPVAVMLCLEEYERLEALEDAWWAARAAAAEESGEWLGTEESEKLLSGILNAED